MVSSTPIIPHRRSSLEPTRPAPPKKRMSLTHNPILSMLGLGRTPSSPTIPFSGHSDPISPIQQHARIPINPSDLISVVDRTEVEDDQTTEVDESEEVMTEEPEPFDIEHEYSSQSTVPEPKPKSKLSLDIPPASSAAAPSSFQLNTDSASVALPEMSTGEEDVLKELGDNQTKRCHGRTPQSPGSSTKGVWLCSRPQVSSPSSPVDENGHRRRSVCRPLVVRAMSTGRLAREFDEDGRVVSLSTHCERVLKGRPVASSPTRMQEGDDLRRTVSNANVLGPTRAGFTRSQTASNIALTSPSRRKSVEAGFRRLESFGPWNKRGAGVDEVRL